MKLTFEIEEDKNKIRVIRTKTFSTIPILYKSTICKSYNEVIGFCVDELIKSIKEYEEG